MRHSMGVSQKGDSMTTQRQVVLDYMMRGNKVSQMFVTEHFGFTRLSSIIFDLKDKIENEGLPLVLKDERVEGINRYGDKCYYKNYWLEHVNP